MNSHASGDQAQWTDEETCQRPGVTSFSQSLTGDEMRIVTQAKILLNGFVVDMAERNHMSTEHLEVLHQATDLTNQEDFKSDDLQDIAMSFRKIGDEVNERITKDKTIERAISSVPVGCQDEVFMTIFKQVFEDGQFNWGRIVVLFYFAYRLISQALSTTRDCLEWIKKILLLAVDYFAKYFVWWVLQRGGWRMIKEYWGTSRTTFFSLVVVSIATGLYYLFK